jgi:hypothetical protein
VDLRHGPGERRWDLSGGLVGDQLDEGVVFGDDVAFFDEPAIDLGLGHAFAQIGQLEIRH